MSPGRIRAFDPTAVRRRVDAASTLFVRVFLGDRLGLVVFLGTLAAVGLTWRIGFLINDNYALANALVALAEGTLVIEEAVFGPLDAPGVGVYDGSLYGRNYGQVAVAVPLLWGLRAVTTVADPGLVFATLWSLVVLALAVQVGRLVERRSLCAGLGSVAALAAFAGNAALAEPLSARLLPVAALQLGTVVAAAFVATTLYRLLERMHDRRVGAVAGAMAVLATPVGFWAAIPKRHVTVTALLLGVCYAFYRSRGPDDGDEALLSPVGFRGLAYALVGLLTWVHAGEGFVVFLALVLVDFPTAPSNDARTLAVVGLAFFASLVPFFVTNTLISGDPLRPPRMLAQYEAGAGESTFGSGGQSSGGTESGSTPLLPPAIRSVVSTLGERSEVLFSPFVAGARTVISDPDALYRTFVRAGYSESIGQRDNHEAINLTILESAPLTAGVVALSVVAARYRSAAASIPGNTDRALRTRLRSLFRSVRVSPVRSTDLLVALTTLLFVLVYMPRLPLHAQVTVRYLLPLYAVGAYGLARQPSIRRVLNESRRAALWSYLSGVLLGVQLFFVVVTVGTFGRGGAFQLHAVAGLAVAAAFVLAASASAFDDRFDRVTAVTGGVAAALGTDLVVLSALVYFQYGPYALPTVDWLADVLASA